MEVTRRRLGAGEIQELRSKQLTARQMLRGDLEGEELERFARTLAGAWRVPLPITRSCPRRLLLYGCGRGSFAS